MYKVLLFSIISLVFVGCTNKNSAFRYFEDTKTQTNLVQNTKKTDIFVDGEPKVLFWASYLNNLQKFKKLDNDTFLITIYFTNANTQDINENSYELFLNDISNISITKVDSSNEIYGPFLVKNKWANSYVVEFKKSLNSPLVLNLTNGINQAQLEFEK